MALPGWTEPAPAQSGGKAADEPRLPRARPDASPPAAASESPVESAPAVAVQGTRVPPSRQARLPRARPDVVDLPLVGETADGVSDFPEDLLMRTILGAVDDGQYGFARFLAATHAHPLTRDLTLWLIARESGSGLSAADIRALETSHPDWPDADRLAWRAEQAFFATQPDGPAVLDFYADRDPSSVRGRLAKADALVAEGRQAEADALVRAIWRDGSPSAAETALILDRHAGTITDDDRHYRYRRAVLSRSGDLAAESALMGPGYLALGEAVRAVIRRDPGGATKLRQVASRFFGDPLYLLARSRLLRREGKPVSAARLLLQIEPAADLQGNGSVWWEERKDLSRELLDLGFPELSYAIAAGHRAVEPVDRAEAEFHAGWYALRFAGKPRLAETHFRNLAAIANLPRSRSRALYWLARAYQADGKNVSATALYQQASAFGGTYYGQLAREAVGLRSTGVEGPPTPTAADRQRIAESPLVQAAALLASGGRPEEGLRFLRRVAETATAPGEITLIVEFARRLGLPRAGMQLAALAEQGGLLVGSLSTPFLGVPQRLPLPDSVDRALVYAVARQESALNHVATSHVGAQGLMQLMPATARATARQAGLAYSAARLSTDPTYNATLGAEHLDELLARFRGSYVLTFVAYNAGPGRANDWIRAYGDPRGNEVDAIDWVERIPFDETRHYVQKVMENLQIYRSRLGRPLSLTRDMARGGPEGEKDERSTDPAAGVMRQRRSEPARFASAWRTACGSPRACSARPIPPACRSSASPACRETHATSRSSPNGWRSIAGSPASSWPWTCAAGVVPIPTPSGETTRRRLRRRTHSLRLRPSASSAPSSSAPRAAASWQ